jgi:hypothetical protein
MRDRGTVRSNGRHFCFRPGRSACAAKTGVNFGLETGFELRFYKRFKNRKPVSKPKSKPQSEVKAVS